MDLKTVKPPRPARRSTTQRELLDRIRSHGGVLERWKSGHWTYPGCPVTGRLKFGNPVPTEHCGWATVSSLVDAGLLHVTASTATRSATRVSTEPVPTAAEAPPQAGGHLRLVA